MENKMKEKNNIRSNSKHLNETIIAICSDRLREEREFLIPDEVRDHLENCESCRDAVLEIYVATENDKKVKPIPPIFSGYISEQKSYSYRLLLKTAATIIILVFISSIYLMINREGPINMKLKEIPEKTTHINKMHDNKHKNHPKKINPSKRIKPARTQINPFKDNPNLEYMVDSPLRGKLIHIISPEFRINERGKIIFKWKNHIDKHLILKILNNTNETIYTLKTDKSRVELKEKLSPGLYYWKLEDSENLYHVGKFIIEK